MISYQSLTHFAKVEIEEKKSRFIGMAKPLQNEADAKLFIAEQREQYKDANHHVYAWLLHKPQHLQRFSDDGEPQGTAGLPVYDCLAKRNITQAGIVVVRYFGGIKLGAGGLVRCYSKAAALAVEAAIPVLYVQHRMYTVYADYADVERLRYQLKQLGYRQTEPQYAANVFWQVAVKEDQTEQFIATLKDLTNDTIIYKKEDLQEFPISV